MTDSRGGKVDWAYHDKANSKTEKLKEQTITHGRYSSKIAYEYNTGDQNTKVIDGASTYRFDYDEQGHVRTYAAPNRAGSTFNYDQTGKLKDLVIGTPNQLILSERYEYDKTGNRTKIKHEGPGGRVTETNYVYDPINQLLKESLPNGTVKDYTYDGFGNRTSVKVTENGKETKSVTATFNEGNQLVKFGNESLTYDANGNRTSDGKYTYTWNESDQLVAVTKKGESQPFVTYKYDDDNRRIEKNVKGAITRYFYDGDSINPLYETDGNGNVLRQYVYSIDGVRLAMKAQGQTLFYHYSPRGDVVAMTDSNGQVVANYEYDAWGNVLKSDTKGIAADNPFGYAGYMYDKEIGMYYLIARYYHPEHGVFISVDPDPGDEDDPLTQNAYTYAHNNPIMKIDADGHHPLIVAAIYGYRAYKAYKTYKKVKKVVKRINGNSRFSKRNNHGYEIYKKVGGKKQVVKVGISGGRISKAGKSYRATRQANKWTKRDGTQYYTRIVKKNMSRTKALKWEQGHVNRVAKAGGKFKHKYHRRPLPW